MRRCIAVLLAVLLSPLPGLAQGTVLLSGNLSGTTTTVSLGTTDSTALSNIDADATTLITHTGGAATSLAILDDWDESDRAKVNLIVGQAGIAAGAGAVGVTVPRVTLASDDPAVALLTTIAGDTTDIEAAVELLDNLVLAESVAHSSGEPGILLLGVRNDAGTALAADGQRIPLMFNSQGSLLVSGGGGGTEYTEGDTDATITGHALLWEDAGNTLRSVASGTPLPVTCATCSGSGVQHVDDAVFTGATDDLVPFGALFDATPPTVTDGRAGLVRMDASRYLYTVFPSAQAVTVSSGSLTANAGTNLNTSLLALESGGNLATIAGMFGTAGTADSQVVTVQGVASMTPILATVTGTVTVTDGAGALNVIIDSSATLTVTATNLDVQSGGADLATEATAAAILTSTNFAAAFGTAGTADTQVLSVQGIASMTALLVGDGAGAFNVICDSGCGSGTVYDHGEAITLSTANGVIGGGRVSAAAPSTTGLADDDFAAFWLLPTGAQVSQPSFAGVLASAGAGANGTGVQRVTVATDDEINDDLDAIAASLSVLDDTAGEVADEYLTVRLTDGSSFLTPSQDWTISSAIGTTGPGQILEAKDFDGAALPLTSGAAEGDAIPRAGSLYGIGYTMLVSEDGALQYGTATTPLIVGDAGGGAMNVIIDSGTVTTVSTVTTLSQLGGVALPVEDVAETAAGVGIYAMGVRRDTPASSATTTGDNTMASYNALGGLWTTPVAVVGGGAPGFRYTSAGSTEDEHAVSTTAATLYAIIVTNTNAAARYLRCENDTAANTAPGSETPEIDLAIPGATTGAGWTFNFGSTGMAFSTAITCWAVTGAADTDVAEVAANEIKLQYVFKN